MRNLTLFFPVKDQLLRELEMQQQTREKNLQFLFFEKLELRSVHGLQLYV